MAKKVKRKLEEAQEPAFEFPIFDDGAFVKKEFELTWGLTLAGIIAVVFGFLDWALATAHVPWWGEFGLAILGAALTPFLIGRVRSGSSAYTKGDWFGLIFLVFFGTIALWLLLINLAP
ncbi:MAG TPA: hypothetical protein VMG99_04765 [Thermoplasmata archaeon]|nr:hypothetical protein [Thermoplasmata archaeon]